MQFLQLLFIYFSLRFLFFPFSVTSFFGYIVGQSQESITASHVRADLLYKAAILNVGESCGTVYMGSPQTSSQSQSQSGNILNNNLNNNNNMNIQNNLITIILITTILTII